MHIRTQEEVVAQAEEIMRSIQGTMVEVEETSGLKRDNPKNPLVVIFDPSKPDALSIVRLWDIAISIAVRQGT